MKKLELKHLDFANNGKVRLSRLPHWDYENVNLQDCELSFNSVTKEPFLRYKDVSFGLDQVKPYKRPLSQLTQEIEHNGERFVPYLRLGGRPNLKDYDIDYLSKNINHISFGLIQQLIEWHFDIYGLIENNLAIEKS